MEMLEHRLFTPVGQILLSLILVCKFDVTPLTVMELLGIYSGQSVVCGYKFLPFSHFRVLRLY